MNEQIHEAHKDAVQPEVEMVNDSSEAEHILEKTAHEQQNMTPEQQEEFLKTITKEVILEPLAPALRASFIAALEEMLDLHKEIAEKMQSATHQNQTIKDRITALAEAKQVTINQDHYSHFDQSITTYVQLLGDIGNEIGREIASLARYADLTEPTTIRLLKTEPISSGVVFITEKTKWMKRHVKTVRKDLLVSFSRYRFGFESQIKQVEALEHMLQHVARGSGKAISEDTHQHTADAAE